MHRRLITPVFFGLLLLAPTQALAQERGGSPDPDRILARMEQRLERMKGPLNLSQRQETQIRQALRRGADRARQVLSQTPSPTPERRDALRQVRWETQDRVHAILTCEQRDQLRRLHREHRSERRAGRGQRSGRRGSRGSPPDGGI